MVILITIKIVLNNLVGSRLRNCNGGGSDSTTGDSSSSVEDSDIIVIG